MNSTGWRLDAALVLASDLHILRPDDERGVRLLDVLGRIEPGKTEALVLNGDVFDFCFGESRFYQEKFRVLGAALSKLAAAGVRVVFIEGNHEFHMRGIGWAGVEFVTVKDFSITLKSGVTVKITHGDLIKDDPWYRRFRAIVKSRFFAFFASLVPGRWLDAWTMRFAKTSRAKDQYRQLDHGTILAAFDRWLAGGARADHGVIGHFHVPYAEKRPQGDGGLMLSVESWDRPNLLVYDEGAFRRIYLEKVGAPFVGRVVEPLFNAR